MKKLTATIVYTAVCALHGLAFGTLSALSQAPLFGLGFIEMVVVGLPFDLTHAAHNLVLGMVLIMPITLILNYTKKYLK